METRAMAIAFFYAVGTAIGGISGPYLFGKLIETEERSQVMLGFLLGGALMIGGGIVQAVLGVEAAGRQLEDIAKPLTAQDAEQDGDGGRPRRRQARGRAGRDGESGALRADAGAREDRR